MASENKIPISALEYFIPLCWKVAKIKVLKKKVNNLSRLLEKKNIRLMSFRVQK